MMRSVSFYNIFMYDIFWCNFYIIIYIYTRTVHILKMSGVVSSGSCKVSLWKTYSCVHSTYFHGFPTSTSSHFHCCSVSAPVGSSNLVQNTTMPRCLQFCRAIYALQLTKRNICSQTSMEFFSAKHLFLHQHVNQPGPQWVFQQCSWGDFYATNPYKSSLLPFVPLNSESTFCIEEIVSSSPLASWSQLWWKSNQHPRGTPNSCPIS